MTTPRLRQQALHHTTIFVPGLTLTDCLTASRQRSEVSYSLRHEGAALTRRLLTNSPTRRLQLYSPSRNCVMWSVLLHSTPRDDRTTRGVPLQTSLSPNHTKTTWITAFIQNTPAAEIMHKFSIILCNSYDVICALLGYCAASSGNFLQTFREKMEQTGCPETSVRNYHYSLPNTTERPSSRDEFLSSSWA